MTKVATLLLRSSCISPDEIDDAIHHSKERIRYLLTTTATTVSQQEHGADGRQAVMPSSHSTIPTSVHARAGTTDNQKNERRKAFDYIASHPIQCYVSLIPRRQPIANNDGRLGIFNATPGQQQEQRGRSMIAVPHYFPKQSFLPCGMNNVISIDQFLTASSHELEEDRDIHVPYLLSLTHCVVNIDHDEIIANPKLSVLDASLPILASPSTFQFSFHYANNNRQSDHSSDARLGLSRVAIGEIQISFDYSIALEYYHEITRPSYQDYAQEATCGKSRNRVDNNSTFSSSSKTASLIDNSEMNEAVASLRRSIMKESLFLTKALFILGCMGIFFIVALVFAVRRIISDKGKRLKGRRSRRLVVNDAIPREIGVLDQSSTKHSSPGSDQASPFLSSPPLSTVRKKDEITPMQSSGAVINGARAIHDTLHLMSPLTPTSKVKKSSSNMQCGEENSSKTLRHYYDDYLSPKRHVRSKSDVTPRSTSDARNKCPRDNGRANEEVIGRRLSSLIDLNSAVDEVSLDNGGGKASQSTDISSLSDLCDEVPAISVENEQSTSDSGVVHDQPNNVTPSSSPTSTWHSSDDAVSESSPFDVCRKNEFSPSATICTQEKTVCYADLDASNGIAPGQKLVYDKSLNSLPKMKVEVERSLFWLAVELDERATGTKSPDLDSASNDFSTLLTKGAFDFETEEFASIPILEDNSFLSSQAKRVAEVEILRTSPVTAKKKVCSPDALPETNVCKKKPLTPVGPSESSRSETNTDEFLSDYW